VLPDFISKKYIAEVCSVLLLTLNPRLLPYGMV